MKQASLPWSVMMEGCFHALDRRKIRFNDSQHRCAVSTADAASLETMVGLCLLTQPELVVGAVIIIGVVVAGVAIAEELQEYRQLRQAHPEAEDAEETARPAPGTRAALEREASASPRPEPGNSGSGEDLFPPLQPRQPRRECQPIPTPHLGGDALHNQCADRVPQNAFPGYDVLVNGKRFDAIELVRHVLWEVKTDNFDTYPQALRDIVLRKQVLELKRERDLAAACGFDFRVGVRSAAHKAALLAQDRFLDIVVMDWC